MNPLLWSHDVDNPNTDDIDMDSFWKVLTQQHHFQGQELETILDHERDYRDWWKNQK